MADRYWIGTGGVAGKVDDAANWSGGLPGGTDNAYFTSGSQSALTGTLPDVVNVVASSGWSGSFGAPGSPLTVGSATKFQFASTGAYCYINVASTKTITTFQIDRGQGSVSGAGTVTTALVGDALCDFSVTVLTNLYAMTGLSNTSVQTSGTAITDFFTYGKHTNNARSITTGEVIGPNGRLITTSSTSGNGAITTLRVKDGAIYNKQSALTDTTVTLSGPGSTVTPSGSPYPTSTITNAYVYSGGTVILNAQGATLSATITYYGVQTTNMYDP